MSVIRAMIVDDEELARAVLKELLAAHRGIELVAECGNGFDAVKRFAETKPDLLFLDVQMPKLDGFEVLELIDSNVAVIFVTAYDVYAMRAFDVHAVDYLLKPVAPERFEAALERVKLRFGKEMPVAADLRAAASVPGARLDRLVIKDGARIHIVPLAKVDYFEAQDDYVGIHSEGKTFLKQQTLSKLESDAGSGTIYPHPSLLRNQCRKDRTAGALQQGFPRGGADGRDAVASQPKRTRKALEGIFGVGLTCSNRLIIVTEPRSPGSGQQGSVHLRRGAALFMAHQPPTFR